MQPMFFKTPANLIVVCKSSFPGRFDAPVDPAQFGRSGMIISFAEAGIDFEREAQDEPAASTLIGRAGQP